MNLIIASILTVSVIFGSEAKLTVKSAQLADQGIKNPNINLMIESEEDIYGIQFDILYNDSHLSLTEDAIISNIQGVKIYSRIKADGLTRVLMFGMDGTKLLDVTDNKIADLINIQFKPEGKYRGTSIVELTDINFVGKAGITVDPISSSYTFEISFLIPQRTSLFKNHPNPFNLTTTIDYELSEPGIVSLVVYDLKGSLVRILVNVYQDENYHTIIWNGLNESGQSVPGGRYILKMETPGFSDTITMTLLK